MENNRDLTLREFYKVYYERQMKTPIDKLKELQKRALIIQYRMYLKGMFDFNAGKDEGGNEG